jgi:hypothetical protein
MKSIKKLLIVLVLFLMCSKVYASPVYMPKITEAETKEKLLSLTMREGIVLVSETEHTIVFEKRDSWSNERVKQSIVAHYVFGTPLHTDNVYKITITFVKKDDGVMINTFVDATINKGQPNEATFRNEKATQELSDELQKEADARAIRLK